MRTPAVLLALALTATPAALAPAGAVGCGALVVQDDAATGADAPDVASQAVPVGHEGSYDGFLRASDVVDWYAVRVAGAGETVMFEAYVPSSDPLYVLGPTLAVEARSPDGSSYEGVARDGGTNVTVEANLAEGTWTFSVALVEVPDPGVACPLAEGGVPSVPDYGFYYGCKPFCLAD